MGYNDSAVRLAIRYDDPCIRMWSFSEKSTLGKYGVVLEVDGGINKVFTHW